MSGTLGWSARRFLSPRLAFGAGLALRFGSGGAVCPQCAFCDAFPSRRFPRRASGIAVLLRGGLSSALCPELSFCRRVMRSVCVCRCGFSAQFAFGSRPAFRFWRGVLPSFMPDFAVLLRCFAFGSRLTSRFCCGVCRRFTPAVCLATNRTACDILRFYSAGRDRHSRVLAALFGYLPLWVHFGFGRLFVAISTGYRGRWVTELAARCLCVFAQSHRPCESFRREYAGAARPRLRQRVFDSLDSLQGLVE